MNIEVIDLITLAKEISSTGYTWIQGTGGNISVKLAKHLLIKPSGVRLEELDSHNSFAFFPLSEAKKDLLSLGVTDETGYSDWLKTNSLNADLRPSMETGFHISISGKYVVHFHSIFSMLMSFLEQQGLGVQLWYKENYEQKLGRILFVPLLLPGLQLSLFLSQHPDYDIYILENHGVILSSAKPYDLDQFREMEIAFLNQYGLAVPSSVPKASSSIEALFPDFAIVSKKLAPFLSLEGHQWILSKNCTDQNLLEIWSAHCSLLDMAPNFPALPKDFVAQLQSLPTELIRKQKLGVQI